MSKETRDIYDRFNGREKEAELLLIVLDQRFFARVGDSTRSALRIFRYGLYVMFIERIYEEDIGFRVDIEFAQNLNLYAKKNVYIYMYEIFEV